MNQYFLNIVIERETYAVVTIAHVEILQTWWHEVLMARTEQLLICRSYF